MWIILFTFLQIKDNRISAQVVNVDYLQHTFFLQIISARGHNPASQQKHRSYCIIRIAMHVYCTIKTKYCPPERLFADPLCSPIQLDTISHTCTTTTHIKPIISSSNTIATTTTVFAISQPHNTTRCTWYYARVIERARTI